MFRPLPLTRSLAKVSATPVRGFSSILIQDSFNKARSAAPPTSNQMSHVLAGFAGGSAVAIGGYGWYKYSGAKEIVAKTQNSLQTIQDVQAKIPPPGVLVNVVKGFMGPLLVSVPGAQGLLDHIQKLEDTHGPEIQKLWHDTVKEVSDLTANGWDEDSTKNATEIIKQSIDRVQELAKNIAGDASEQLLSTFPQVKDALGGSIEELKELSGKGGDEAKELLSNTFSKMKKILDGGMNENTIEEIKKLIDENKQEVKKLVNQAGELAWDKGIALAGPFLDKMPEVKKEAEKAKDLLSEVSKEHGPQLMDMANDLMSQLKKISEKGVNEETIKEAKTLVEKKLSELKGLKGGVKQQTWQKAEELAEPVLKKVPELKQVVDKSIPEMKSIAERKGPEAFKIIKDTYADIQKIAEKGANKETIQEGKELLEKRLEELKKLADQAKQEGEKVGKEAQREIKE
ncbi:hypothetical protein K493DRAFT_308571 [Basidiobolus meristosporus CBS 931.73]|uniref:Uncharacterized protein n=1 Tax=Basidiobolus meristosporus CBS 931.73 TaxID=1314790 RepID=A0A1Y1X0R5_9FUNG|nr:hypothetical protein K493DRAFT_308571 [Basidiobolus meristosporus CBS 931.73]|eukprot:ORX79198.1 hypothetical protein K493DRAFT_308571 [Basidiobolus meristosporus CBS 931.73]